MKLKLKHYKFEKAKNLLKTQGFLIASVGCFKTLKDNTLKYKLSCFLAKNTICKIIFKNSIFTYFKFLLGSSIIFINLNFHRVSHFKTIKNLNIIGVKLYDKIYSLKQLMIVNSLNYNKNIKSFCFVLKKLILNAYVKLVKV